MNNKFILVTDPETGRLLEATKLIAAYINGKISISQCMDLKNWLDENDSNVEIFRHLTDPVILHRLLQEKYN